MRHLITCLAAGLIAVGGLAPALADPPGDRAERHGRAGHDRDRRAVYDRHDGRWYDRSYGRWPGEVRRDWRWDGSRGWPYGWDSYDSYRDHPGWRGSDDVDWRPGSRSFVIIRDYARYRLPPPRYGEVYYRDQRTGEILLIAAATGLILWALGQ